MRTTPTIDDDVLEAAKGPAERHGISVGAAISDLSRQALRRSAVAHGEVRNGIPLLARRPGATPVTPELVARLRDQSCSPPTQ